MLNSSRWYERERWPYTADRNNADEYAQWLQQIPWQLFCTFTFAWRVSDPQANETFREFINRLERHLKYDVAYVRGDEKRFSGCGKAACARHYHVLLACAAPVSSAHVESLWMGMAGNRSDNAGAVVRPYDPNLNGASYVMKLINGVDGDWAFRNLHLFQPLPSEGTITKRMRRHLGRHRVRAQKFLHAKDPQLTHLDMALLELTTSTLYPER
jgi:hypothetical protein